MKDTRVYIESNPCFSETGHRMLKEWEAGSATSLRPA
jgi:hypothetical protein